MGQVLVVEDYPTLAKVIAIAIERLGLSVQRVGSCQRALALPAAFDLAVIDIDLPDGNGVELAEQLLERGSAQAVVFYTASRDPGWRAKAAKLGCVVNKESHTLHVLAEAVRNALSARGELAQAVGAQPIAKPESARSGTRRRVR